MKSSINPVTGKQQMDPEHIVKDDGKEAPAPKTDPTGGKDFNTLMQDAVKLKEEQLKPLKRRWDRLGEWRQHTLFHGEAKTPDGERVREGRKLKPAEQLSAAQVFKEEGNMAFKAKNLKGAMDKYEMALALLWYLQPTVEDWRTKGIQDDHMEEVDLRKKTKEPKLRDEMTIIISQILTNIAVIKLKEEKYAECVQASTDALDMHPNCVKGFYFRAKARLASKKSGATEYEMCLKDLNKAVELKPEDKTFVTLRNNLKKSLQQQSAKDKKQFKGMFERGEVVKKNEKKPEQIKKEKAREKQKTELDFQKLMQMANGCAHKAQELQKRGDNAGAAKLMKQANEIRAHLEAHRKAGLAGLAQDEPNFDTPTEAMVQTARMNFGIDLKDPQVANYLKALQSEKKDGNHVKKQHHEEPAPTINWTMIISIVVIIMSYRMWATGTGKVLREDVFGWRSSDGVSAGEEGMDGNGGANMENGGAAGEL
jgi:tetratricopeptide (TPR) repeat protein